MALTAENRQSNLIPLEQWRSRKRENMERPDVDDVAEVEMTAEEQAELAVARYCHKLLSHCVKAREPYETFDKAWELYIGDMWPSLLPKWKAKITINKIRAIIHFIQAVMTDNKPRMSIKPEVPGTENAAKLLDKLHDRHWEKSQCQDKISLATLYGLIWGTGIMKHIVQYSYSAQRYKHVDTTIPPYRIYTNKHATSVEDARVIVHIEPKPLGWVYENFPDRASKVKRFRGAKINSDENTGRDLINEGQTPRQREKIVSPLTMSGVSGTLDMPRDVVRDQLYDDDQDEIEVAEFWFCDESEERYRCVKVDEYNNPIMEDVLNPETGLPELEQDGEAPTPSPLDGRIFMMPQYKKKQRPVYETKLRPKYPNGRLVIMAGPVVLRDIPNPFQIDGFPFSSWKDWDVGVFWGQGEPLQLKDMNIGINRVAGQIYDNLNLAGNTSYLVAKDSGINPRKWRNKPASLIPVDDINAAVKKLEQGSVPPQAMELVSLLKESISEVSGINDIIMGATKPDNTAFNTIDQLQESSAATVRLRVRNLEKMLVRMGRIRTQLIQQFAQDAAKEPIREDVSKKRFEQMEMRMYHDEEGEPYYNLVVPPADDVEVQFRKFLPWEIQGPVEFSVVPDSSLSTSPAGMWNRYMQLWDKKLIDPIGFHEKFQLDDWQGIVGRLMSMQAAGSGKPGPKGGASKGGARPRNAGSPSSMPTPAQLAQVR